MRVYVAGPISKPPLETNIRRAIDAGNLLMENGFHPFIPHLYCFMQITHPHGYERWMELDCAFLLACEAVFRVSGDSPGADRECSIACEREIPVFHSIHDLISYRDQKSKVRELAPDLSGVEPTKVRGSGELSPLGRTLHDGVGTEAPRESAEENSGGLGS